RRASPWLSGQVARGEKVPPAREKEETGSAAAAKPDEKGPPASCRGPFFVGLGEERSASAPLLALELLAVLLVRVERDLDAAVLLPAGLGRVRGDGLALAHARDLHPARRDALLREIRRDGVRAALRERLVVVLGARRVRVADDERVRVRVLVQAAREVHEVLP